VIPISAPGAPGTFIYDLSFTPSGPSDKLNFALSGFYDLSGNYDPSSPADTTTVGHTLAYACGSGPNTTLPSTNYCGTAYWDSLQTSNTVNPGTFGQDNGWNGLGAGLIAFDATPTAIPEPATLGLIGLGLMAFAAVKRAKNRS
jgi:hypothetical protein